MSGDRVSTEYGARVHAMASGLIFAQGTMRCGVTTRRVVPSEPGAPLCPKCFPSEPRTA